jgi:hypothetical protein
MPFNTESLFNESRQEFCLALKSSRERKGIALAEIEKATKIPAYLFAGLERGDLRRWPKGFFRRSFFRDYVRMIGLPVEETTAEFVLLFPDAAGAEVTKGAGSANRADQANGLRLAFDAAWHGPRASVTSRLLAALIDTGAVVLVAAALAWAAGKDQAATTAVFALAYFCLATAIFGESPAKWILSRRRSIADALTRGTTDTLAGLRRGGDAISRLLGSANGSTPEAVEEPEMGDWVTDADRVGPAPRLRVRVKLSQ